jgi:hypothetical protein
VSLVFCCDKKSCLINPSEYNFFLISRLRLNSLLATYDVTPDKQKFSNQNQRSKYPPLRQRGERERPRSIKLKPQEYFLFFIAISAIAALVIYNVFMSYYSYYTFYSITDDVYD